MSVETSVNYDSLHVAAKKAIGISILFTFPKLIKRLLVFYRFECKEKMRRNVVDIWPFHVNMLFFNINHIFSIIDY
ncbi:MAG: hypothetical protein QCI00_02895 [Candidatus Thermoplasmatota archaeon]|nr:hypothetical protein [Candidatus Thermoplasmatota archaeon]